MSIIDEDDTFDPSEVLPDGTLVWRDKRGNLLKAISPDGAITRY